MERIEALQQELQSHRDTLIMHTLYHQINDITNIQTFMKHHVFAVWDFMSLVKSLQENLTTIYNPWIPASNPVLVRFINEIVLAEESDFNKEGKPMSHFEMYLEAMAEVKADTTQIKELVSQIAKGVSVRQALKNLDIDQKIKEFVSYTFDIIDLQKPHITAAVFTMGREDLIPDLFLEIVKKLQSNTNTSVSKLVYYLERHIELDGDTHGPLSLKVIENLCGSDDIKWKEAQYYGAVALEKRLILWNSISDALTLKERVLL